MWAYYFKIWFIFKHKYILIQNNNKWFVGLFYKYFNSLKRVFKYEPKIKIFKLEKIQCLFKNFFSTNVIQRLNQLFH